MSPVPEPTKEEIAEYVEQMLLELMKLAKKIGNKNLTLLICIAAIFASPRYRELAVMSALIYDVDDY
jgi:xylose isomerase